MSALPARGSTGRRVSVLAFPGMSAFELGIATEAFGLPRPEFGVDWYDLAICAEGGAPVRMIGGATLAADGDLAVLAAADTVIIPGVSDVHGDVSPELGAALRRAHERGARVVSICSGAFALAGAGLLDGRRATTHWAFCESLARRFPRVRVEPEPIFVRDGPIWTSAGVTAGIDLALALVEEDLGRAAAMTVARYLVMFVRRSGGQSQFSALLQSQAAEREPIRELVAWIAEHLGDAGDVPALARRAGMSVRNFARVFRAQTGTTPAAHVARARLEAARRLLESTSLPIERVAEAAGFAGPETLRRAFARHVRLAPREYRARFGA